MTALTPVGAVDLALDTIAAYGRPDLTDRLHQSRARLLDEHVRVLVVGEFKQGKSMLVNGLIGVPVCPVFDDVATSVPTVVRHADTPTAALVRELDSAGDPDGKRVERIEVPVEEVAKHVSESGNPGNQQRLSYAEVGLPLDILAGGLEIVDTPGVGGLKSVHGAATMAALPSADAVLLVSDASQEYTKPELEFLRQAIRLCPNVACVITKTDLYPEWRRIAELDRAHLKAAGVHAELFTVSSTLRWHAVQGGDARANTESGFPTLVAFLRKRVMGQTDLLARRSTVHDVMSVTDHIVGNLRAEQTAARNPENLKELIEQLTVAQQRAAALKERSARWQHTLNDGVADLTADIEHDLRDRLREIRRVGEEELDGGGDPLKTWQPFSTWVEQQVAAAAAANALWSTERTRWLAQQVAEHFSEDEEQILPRIRAEVYEALRAVREMTAREGEPWHIGHKVLTGIKGGYVGVLMFGLLGTLVGLSLINPFSLGAGLLLGGKTISDERRRIITRRQNEAKATLRRYVDDATFQVGKDSRDVLRGVQRTMRDHFTAQAEELNRSLKDSLQAAEKSVKTSKADRERRLTEITSELERFQLLQRRVATLLPTSKTSPGTTPPTNARPKDAPPKNATPGPNAPSASAEAGSGRHRAAAGPAR